MADSTTTKKAIATSFKHLLRDVPFSKISISDICVDCDMNRKSFYYHFKDKYDLVNWIFDTEIAESIDTKDKFQHLDQLCTYLYINRDYYKRVFQIDGQNSFRSHFSEIVTERVLRKIKSHTDSESNKMKAHFISCGFVCTIERWLYEKNPISPDKFCQLLCDMTIRSFN